MSRNKKRVLANGFTLIELIISVAILTVVVGVVVQGLTKLQQRNTMEAVKVSPTDKEGGREDRPRQPGGSLFPGVRVQRRAVRDELAEMQHAHAIGDLDRGDTGKRLQRRRRQGATVGSPSRPHS